MGIISNLVPDQLKTSGMKGMTSGQYGQNGVVGTIIKMYLGGAIGGALGGAAGGGASGIAGASNGLSSVTSNLGSMFSGGGAGAGAGGGGLGGLGGILGGEGGGGLGSILGGGEGGGSAIGNIAQNLLSSGSNGGGGASKSAPDMSQPQVSNMPAPQGMEAIQGIMGMIQRGQGNPQQQDNGLMSQPGIPDYIKQMMQRWQK